MNKQLTNDNILKDFLRNLQNQGKSMVSVKNYKSDIGHFLAWAILKLKSFGAYAESVAEVLPFIDRRFFSEYKDYMIENKLKLKTVNRRLSTIRNFSSFLQSVNLVSQDFMKGIQNAGIGIQIPVQEKDQEMIARFRESLEKEDKASANTIKNYVSDVKSFLAWVNADKAKAKGELPNGI